MRDAAPNYYNEFDPAAAAWLRELIAAGMIPHGDVDERSIEDVKPGDLRGYRQHHFFAGIGGWAYALALAGWPADRPVWTGSCPCQPFSAAGKGAGFDDQRHLWPAWFHLIRECRPPAVFGEQVASKAADPWIDLVHADLEGVGYAFGCVPFPAAGIGAPHIRDRTYWMAYADRRPGGQGREDVRGRADGSDALSWAGPCGGGVLDGLGHANHQGLEGHRGGHRTPIGHRQGAVRPVTSTGEPDRLADTDGGQRHGVADGEGRERNGPPTGRVEGYGVSAAGGELRGRRTGPTNGPWRDADWLGCRDGKWRPVEPGSQPLVDGLPRGMVHVSDPCTPFHPAEARAIRLKGYGNAIVPEAAAEFIVAAELARADMLGIEQRAAA